MIYSYRSVGISDCRTVGLSDCRIIGLSDYSYGPINKTFAEAAVNTIGYRTKKNKEWSISETWQHIEEWKSNKLRMIHAKSIRLQKQLKTAYTIKEKEVKRSGRRDRKTFIDNLEHEAEQAAAHGEMSTAYRITKQLNQVKKLALILLRKTYIVT
jgi:hypothetical protein